MDEKQPYYDRIKELQGHPLTIYLMLLIRGSPVTQKWLQDKLGRSKTTIREGLQKLEEANIAVQHNRKWLLVSSYPPLLPDLGGPSLPAQDPPALPAGEQDPPSDYSHSPTPNEGQPTDRIQTITLTMPSDWTVMTIQIGDEGPENGPPTPKGPENGPSGGTTYTTYSQKGKEASVHVSSSTVHVHAQGPENGPSTPERALEGPENGPSAPGGPENGPSAETSDPEIVTVLKEFGVVEPYLTEIISLATPHYIRAQIARLKSEAEADPKRADPRLLLRVIRDHHDPIPVNYCSDCDKIVARPQDHAQHCSQYHPAEHQEHHKYPPHCCECFTAYLPSDICPDCGKGKRCCCQCETNNH